MKKDKVLLCPIHEIRGFKTKREAIKKFIMCLLLEKYGSHVDFEIYIAPKNRISLIVNESIYLSECDEDGVLPSKIALYTIDPSQVLAFNVLDDNFTVKNSARVSESEVYTITGWLAVNTDGVK
jgi:hypothetical protein